VLKYAFANSVTSQLPRSASVAKDFSTVVLYEKPGTFSPIGPPALDGADKFTRPFIPPTGKGFVFGKIKPGWKSILFVLFF
jgi:hypothetical protein